MRLGKTALSHFASQVVVTLSGFAATFLIAVVLGAEGLGQYAVVVSLGFFWLLIPANAVTMAVKKRMSEGETPGRFLGGGILLNTGIGVVLVALVLSAGELLGGVVSRDRELMVVLIEFDTEIAAIVLAAIAFRTVRSALHGQKRVAEGGWLKAAERAVRTILQVGALLLGLGVTGVSFGHAASLLVVAVAGILLSRYRPRLPSVADLRSLADYARFAWVGALRSRVFGWLDTLVLSVFVGASLIGIYEAAWGIASMLAIASGSISHTLFPEISDISTEGSVDQVRHYLDEALAFSAIFVIPGLAGIAVLGTRVLSFYRPEFGRGTGVLLILVVAYLADVFASQFTSVINAVDRPDAAFRVNLLFIVTNIVLNVVLVSQVGWYGAAIATAVSAGLRAVAGYWVLESIIGGITVPFVPLGRQVAAALVMAGAVYPVVPLAPAGRIGTLLLAGLGAAVYAGVLLAIAPRIRSKTLALLPERA
jgi:O-antigen/teichoic acid export membrane protein